VDVTSLTDVLEPLGPSTTVTIDAAADDPTRGHERHLRWRDLRGELEQAGAPADDLAALDQVVDQPTGVAGEASRYLAARGGQVVLDELFIEDALNGVGSATTGPILDVVPLLRYEARHAPVLVVRADREGADIEVVRAAGGPVQDSASTHGSTFRIHKVGIGGWRAPQYQRRTASTWGVNADQDVDEINRLVREHACVAVILSGDVYARNLIAERLGVQVPVVQVEGDTRAAGSSTFEVDLTVARGLDERAARTEDEAVQRWRAVRDDPDTQARTTGDLHETALAIRQGQVEELLLVPAALRGRKLLVGPTGPDVALPGTQPPWDGPTEEAPADLALVRAAAATGAQVQLVELESAEIPDGAAARLRWSTDETPGTEGGQGL
jgi:Bacterial archaeo-eukaryotic release factor family 2